MAILESNPSKAHSSQGASDKDSGAVAGLHPWENTSGTFETSDELDCRNETDFPWGSPRNQSLMKGS